MFLTTYFLRQTILRGKFIVAKLARKLQSTFQYALFGSLMILAVYVRYKMYW